MANKTSKFTKAQKDRALELLETETVWAAVTEIGCSHTTVYRWDAQRVREHNNDEAFIAAEQTELAAMRTRTRRRLLETATAHIDRSDSARTARDAKDYMTAAAIALDKYRLEMGEATARHYVEGHDDIDRRVNQLVAELDTRSKAASS